MRIPRTRIQALGWPVNVDRLEEAVLADVVVGDDGLARAVRLVRTTQKIQITKLKEKEK